MPAAVEVAPRQGSVADDAASAVLKRWRHALDGTFERVERVHRSFRVDLERPLAVIASHLAACHLRSLLFQAVEEHGQHLLVHVLGRGATLARAEHEQSSRVGAVGAESRAVIAERRAQQGIAAANVITRQGQESDRWATWPPVVEIALRTRYAHLVTAKPV